MAMSARLIRQESEQHAIELLWFFEPQEVARVWNLRVFSSREMCLDRCSTRESGRSPVDAAMLQEEVYRRARQTTGSVERNVSG